MPKEYFVEYEARRQGAIGNFETQTRIVPADTPEEALEVAQGLLNKQGFETRFPKGPPRIDPLFIGIFPAGVSYADRTRERRGDFVRLAFLTYDTLELTIEADCPPALRQRIVDDAARIQARKGQSFPISTGGQTVELGSRVK